MLTKFIFPKYIPTFEGNGTPNNTAFKKITAGPTPKSNFGLVDIDISGASIEFKTSPGNPYHDNIIL